MWTGLGRRRTSPRLPLLVAADLQTEHTVNKQRPFDGLEVVSSWAERHADHLCKVYLPDLPLRLSRQAGEEVGREFREMMARSGGHEARPTRKANRGIVSLLGNAMGGRDNLLRAVLGGQVEDLISGVTRQTRTRP